MTELRVTYPDELQLLSISSQRDGWHCVLRTRASLFAMSSLGKGETAQEAVDSAVARVAELVREIPRRPSQEVLPSQVTRRSVREEAEELAALLGL